MTVIKERAQPMKKMDAVKVVRRDTDTSTESEKAQESSESGDDAFQ